MNLSRVMQSIKKSTGAVFQNITTAIIFFAAAGCAAENPVSEYQLLRTDTVLVLRDPQLIVHDPPFIPENLDRAAESEVFSKHMERALERRRLLEGKSPARLFDKVVAAADYVANLAKHPYRHDMGDDLSDPRAELLIGHPEQLARLAEENQVWTGKEWVPVPDLSIADVPPLECTYQHLILGGLVNVIGAQWRLIQIEGHTAFSYYDFEFGKWIYIESTFNEHYRNRSSSPEDYVPLSPAELHLLSVSNRTDRIVAVRHPYQPQRFGSDNPHYVRPYVQRAPRGWAPMALHQVGRSLGSRNVGYDVRVLPNDESRLYFGELIEQGWVVDDSPQTIWSPQGETFLLELQRVSDIRFAVILSTNLAVEEPVFERRIGGRRGWAERAAVDTLSIFPGMEIHYRARSKRFVSGEIVLKGS